MTQLIAQPGERVRELAADVSALVIDEAVGERAPVRFKIGDPSRSHEIAGRIAGGDDTTLTVELNASGVSTGLLFAAPAPEATIIVGGLRYMFPARCVRPVSGTDTNMVYLVRPQTIATVQRRRSRRYRFQQPMMVTLFFGKGKKAKGHSAAMLNISPDGVACRVRQQDAGRTAVGRTLRVRVLFDATAHVFDLPGRVITVTQASTKGHVVLGVEFIADDETKTARESLRVLLDELTWTEDGS